MLAETDREGRLPAPYRWESLARQQGLAQLEYYRQLPLDLGNIQKTSDPLILAILTDAQTELRKMYTPSCACPPGSSTPRA